MSPPNKKQQRQHLLNIQDHDQGPVDVMQEGHHQNPIDIMRQSTEPGAPLPLPFPPSNWSTRRRKRQSSRQDKNEADQSSSTVPQENKLYIVKKEAEEHFRALNTSKISEVDIEISDAENETYHMKLEVYPKTGTNSDAYKITWKSFGVKLIEDKAESCSTVDVMIQSKPE
ncbi:hypothetical protein LOK49_LG15G00868 [Camellia lanceoleosa]|uniref:Uncharacterized protein n=1 Tax=Camellia lanceoleosa TaxID=1840588 RepID=A0ACC0F478_9ERIC|nr:hypothetical protein LOK49_LG15G00868 [Camellia lanceoleosa]